MYMCKFEGRSSMKQYIKKKPNKWALNVGIDMTVKQVTSINQNCTKGKKRKGTEFRFQCGTSTEKYLLSHAFG